MDEEKNIGNFRKKRILKSSKKVLVVIIGAFLKKCKNAKTAYRQAGNYGHVGIAFVLTNIPGENIRNDIFYVDLDNALKYNQKNDNFKLTLDAEKILEKFRGTYIEQSASGKGIHIFGIGNIPNNN